MKTIIIKPFITEKTYAQAARGWYTFVVALKARKAAIASAVADLYKVKVIDVRTAHMHGKTRRAGRRRLAGIKPDWKKAQVRLLTGQKIDAFEVSSEGTKQ